MPDEDLAVLLLRLRRRVITQTDAAGTRITRQMVRAVTDIEPLIRQIAARVAADLAAGVTVDRNAVARLEQLQRARQIIEARLTEAAQTAMTQTVAVRQAAITAALEHTATALTAVSVPIPAVDPVAVLSQATRYDTILRSTLAQLPRTVAQKAVDQIVAGVATGRPLPAISRDIAKTAGVSARRAATIVRTEALTAYREASRQRYQAAGVTEWVWVSALDERSCAACWALHGRRFNTSEKMGTHPNCRCTLVPVVPGLAEGPTPDDTAARFRNLDDATQRRILGAGGLNLYREGVPLTEFATRRENPRYGTAWTRKPLRNIATPT